MSNTYLKAEFTGLFLLLPLFMVAPIDIRIILALVAFAIGYIIYVSVKTALFSKRQLVHMIWPQATKPIVIRFLLFLILSTILVAAFAPDQLFIVVKNNPLLWIAITIFYSVFSVYPQEFIYRHFFIKRYESIFTSTSIMIFINGLIFSLAHSFLFNGLVMVLTFVGGLLFCATYLKSRSLIVTSIEHSVYGVWLFTLGLGEMLAFPGA